MKQLLSAMLLAGLCATQACAQPKFANETGEPLYERVLPGSTAIDASGLKPGVVRYVNKTNQMNIGLEQEEYDGVDVMTARVWFNAAIGEGRPDTIRFDRDSLAFVHRNLGNPDIYVIDVAFTNDNRFVGELVAGADSGYTSRTYDKAYLHRGFEPSILFFYVPALPLELGYKASLPTFDLNDGSQMIWANISVAGREKVKIGDRTFDTLKVVSNGIKKKTIWVAPEYPFPVKMITQGSLTPWVLDLETTNAH